MAVTQSEIKFRPNAPETVQLDRDPDQAQEKTGLERFGSQVRYRHTCNANQNFFYLSEYAHKQLVKTRAEAGDHVRITKSVEGDSTTWGIVVLADASEPEPPQPQPGPRMVTRTSGGNALAAQPAAAPPQQVSRGNSHLAQCLYAAVDAAIEASEYARSKNFSVTFLGSDIRAMAASLFINDNNNQGGRS